jgi:RloB-like protein
MTIVVCEGRLTEPDYFYGLARSCGALVSFEKAAGAPLSVVNEAIDQLHFLRRATTFSRYDFWAVFDRDEHRHFDEAIGSDQEKSCAARNPQQRPADLRKMDVRDPALR